MEESGKITSFDEPVFYPISIKKLCLMSVATFGIYYLFWAYKNNKWIEKNVDDIYHRPLLCTIFLPITLFGLVFHIIQIGEKNRIKSFRLPFIPPILFVIFTLFKGAPEPLNNFYFLTVIPILIIGNHVNKINRELGITKINDQISVFHWLFVLPMILFSVVSITLSIFKPGFAEWLDFIR